MPPPTAITRQVNALLAARGLTRADLAKAIGRNIFTIRNVLTLHDVQPPTRRAITDFLGVEIFPGVKPDRRGITFKLPAGTEIALPSPVVAKLLESLFRGAARRAGNRIEFLEPAIIRIPTTASQKPSIPTESNPK